MDKIYSSQVQVLGKARRMALHHSIVGRCTGKRIEGWRLQVRVLQQELKRRNLTAKKGSPSSPWRKSGPRNAPFLVILKLGRSVLEAG